MENNANFKSPNHALTAGMAWGLLMQHGIVAYPEVDENGDYTDILRIEHEDTWFQIKVLP